MGVSLSLAGVHEVDRVWQQVAEGLERACRVTGGDLTADYLWSECRAGAAFLVVIAEENAVIGASVWRFEKWSTGKKLRCLALYGRDMKRWLEDHRRLAIEMAKAGQATALVTGGRKGWERVFPEAKVIKQIYEVAL